MALWIKQLCPDDALIVLGAQPDEGEFAMAERRTSNDARSDGVLPSTRLSLRNTRETNVPMVGEAPTPPVRSREGPRHVIPPVPEGPDIPDQTPSLPMTIETLERVDTQ